MKKLNTNGIAHLATLAIVVLGVAAFGTYLLTTSHAATPCKATAWSMGEADTCVAAIQRITNASARHWHYSGGAILAIDGSFGPKTKAQVQAIQQYGHLSQDGVVGPKTWTMICEQARLLRSSSDGYKAAVSAGCVYTTPAS
jgi:zinc D-Ala-D-Ala carboxypeptidase